MEQKELEQKLAALGELSDEQKRGVVCSLIGHSKIVHYCLGYINCARCGDQIGDALGGAYNAEENVIVGHACQTCKKNFAELGWQDKFMAPDPFPETVDD